MYEIVLATTNKGKIKEINDLLKDFPIKIKTLNDFGPIPEIKEDGKTFEENAYKKASMTARFLGLPAIADDSGLCVEALNGEPGVHSARFSGLNASDKENNEKLLALMKNIKNRKARFETVISIAVPTGHALTYEGFCEGEILEKEEGEKGFGYDPLFYYPPFKKSFANLLLEEKNKISHRGKALLEVQKDFNKILTWLNQNMPKFEKFDCKKEG